MDPACHSIAVVTCRTLLYSVTVIDACVLTWTANGIVVSGRRPLIKGYAALRLIVGAGHDPFRLILPATTVVHRLTGPALFEWEDSFFPGWHCHRHRPSPIAITKSRPVLSGITVRANERIAPAPPAENARGQHHVELPPRQSSMLVAMPGTLSWPNPRSSPQLEPEIGHR